MDNTTMMVIRIIIIRGSKGKTMKEVAMSTIMEVNLLMAEEMVTIIAQLKVSRNSRQLSPYTQRKKG